MANMCCSSVAFYVNATDCIGTKNLLSLHDAIDKSMKKGKKQFRDVIGVPANCITYGGYFDYIHDMEDVSPYKVFYVDAATNWSPAYEFFAEVAKKYGVSYAVSSDGDGEFYEIAGDPNGVLFPHNYSTDIWENDLFIEGCEKHEEGTEFFNTKESLLDFLRTLNTDFSSDDLNEWDEYLGDDLGIGHIRVWSRIDLPAA